MKKQRIQINIKADELKKKLDIRNGKDGEKGDKGDKGDTPDIQPIIQEATKQATDNAIKDITPKIPTIEQVVMDLPKFGEKVRDGLELLKDDNRLDKSAIRGIDDYEEISKLAREPRKIEKIYNGGGGARQFTVLTDTPNSYSGQTGKYVRVNTTEDALEFASIDLSGYVPYTGATADVNIGVHEFIGHAIKGDASDGLLIEANNGTDIGILGAGNTANVTWYGNHNFNAQTANTIAIFGASKTLSSADTSTYPSLTELSYVKGVTSSIQTQLDGKQPSGTYVTGATDSTLTLTGTTLGVNLSNSNAWLATQKFNTPNQSYSVNPPTSFSFSFSPNVAGFYADGQYYEYTVYSYRSTPVGTVFDSTGVSYGATDPNDGNYYEIDLTWVQDPDASGYFVYDTVNNQYIDVGNTSGVAIDPSTSWTAGSPTLSPTNLTDYVPSAWTHSESDWYSESINVLSFGLSGGYPLRLLWSDYSGGSGWLQFDDSQGNIQTIRANISSDSITLGGSSISSLFVPQSRTLTINGTTYDLSANRSWTISTGMTNPMTTLGDIIYENATPTPARLAGNTTTTQKFLTQTGTGSASAAPSWFDLYNTANTWGANQYINAVLGIGNTSPTSTRLSITSPNPTVTAGSGTYTATLENSLVRIDGTGTNFNILKEGDTFVNTSAGNLFKAMVTQVVSSTKIYVDGNWMYGTSGTWSYIKRVNAYNGYDGNTIFAQTPNVLLNAGATNNAGGHFFNTGYVFFSNPSNTKMGVVIRDFASDGRMIMGHSQSIGASNIKFWQSGANIEITSATFTNCLYAGTVNLASDGSGSNDVRLTVSKDGNGANKTIQMIAYRYAIAGDSPKLQIVANGIDFGLRDGTPSWGETIDKLTMSMDKTTGNWQVGNLGTSTPTGIASKFAVTDTDPNQFRVRYDASNEFTLTVNSTGGVTFDSVGSGAGFTFSDNVSITDKNLNLGSTTGSKIGATGDKIGFLGATPIVRPSALTTQLTTITASAPGTPDYAIADLTNITPYGFTTQDEGQTVLKVIANLQTRVSELETKLQSLGLLT